MRFSLEHCKKKDNWFRLLFTLLFLMSLFLIRYIVLMLSLSQLLCCFIFGGVPSWVVAINKIIASYISQLVSYILFAEDVLPYPFNLIMGKKSSAFDNF